MFPIAISLGSAHYPFYEGLYFALSILIGALVGYKLLRKGGADAGYYYNLILVAVLAAVVGGRLFHILFWQPAYYFADPVRMLKFWEGGISITGGIVAGVGAGYLYCRKKKIEFFKYLALIVPAILLAQGIGRLGCFLNGDAFGLPTSLPWGVEFHRYAYDIFKGAVDTGASGGAWNWCFAQGLVSPSSTMSVPMHPTQLYEALFDFACMAFFLVRNARKRDYAVSSWLYLASFTLFRFAVEYIRGDREVVVFLGTSALQLFFLALGIGCVVLAALRSRRLGRAEAK